MSEPYDAMIARARAAIERSRQVRAKLESATVKESRVIADESWRMMQGLVKEARALSDDRKVLRQDQATILSGAGAPSSPASADDPPTS